MTKVVEELQRRSVGPLEVIDTEQDPRTSVRAKLKKLLDSFE
jgi:hypothetical protein